MSAPDFRALRDAFMGHARLCGCNEPGCLAYVRLLSRALTAPRPSCQRPTSRSKRALMSAQAVEALLAELQEEVDYLKPIARERRACRRAEARLDGARRMLEAVQAPGPRAASTPDDRERAARKLERL